jgi:LysM repeat protein
MPKTEDSQTDHVHIIVSGETLSKIADRYHIKLSDLRAANPQIKSPNKILAGQKLKIPHAIAPVPVLTTPVVIPPSVSSPPAGDLSAHRGGMPITKGLSAVGKYDLYSQFFIRFGVNLAALAPNVRSLLGLRVTSNTNVRDGAGEYNDRVVVAWRDSNGAKQVEEFVANTEPSARYEGKEGIDANLDGRRDLGSLLEGFYEYQKGTSKKYGNILRPVRDIYVIRDIDHDGDFDAKEKAGSIEALLNSRDTILFHKGGSNITGSAGCQTFQPAEFDRFWRALGNQKRFQYVLCTVA